MTDEKLTHSFMLSEFIASDTALRLGIDNTPPPAELANIKAILAPGMQRVRDALGRSVLISSGYRSKTLNAVIKGSPNSSHMKGLAADFRCPGFGPPNAVVRALMKRAGDIGFDQMIYEGTWVHIGFAEPGRMARHIVMTAHFSKGGAVTYSEGMA
jgi:zinc D-Ala-D-Ala carboxypeptidase